MHHRSSRERLDHQRGALLARVKALVHVSHTLLDTARPSAWSTGGTSVGLGYGAILKFVFTLLAGGLSVGSLISKCHLHISFLKKSSAER